MTKKLIYIFLAVLLFACSDASPETSPSQKINIDRQVLNFSAEAGYQSVTVSIDASFTVVSDHPEWCQVAVSKYITDNLRVTVSKNEIFGERTAKVTVSADGMETVDVAVTQSGIAPVLSVDQKNIVIQTGKPEFTLDVNANVPIVFELPGWISEKDGNTWVNGKKTYAFVASSLPGDLSFREGIIKVCAANPSVDVQSVSVSVVQRAIPKIIAHRGYWDKPGSAQNSLSSLENAIALGAYGSELDVWITTDGVVVLNHDNSYQGVVIEKSAYTDLDALRLANGEPIPTLQQCIDLVKNQDKTKLIIEIKAHSTVANENRAVAAVIKLVNDGGVTHLVDYISFSENICNELIKASPQHRVAYLNGNKTPEELKSAGYWGLDYSSSVLKAHPEWVSKAKELGLTSNVWTVNSISDMQFFMTLGVDFITTDNPQGLKDLLY